MSIWQTLLKRRDLTSDLSKFRSHRLCVAFAAENSSTRNAVEIANFAAVAAGV